MRIAARSALLLALSLGLGLVRPAATRAAEETVPLPAEETGFPLEEVTRQAELLDAALQGVRKTAGPDPEVARLEGELLGLEGELADARVLLADQLDPVPLLSELADLETQWVEGRRDLVERRARVDARVRSLQATRVDLASRRARWEATLARAKAEGAPQVILDLARSTIEELGAVDRVAGTRLGLLFELQQRLSSADRLVDGAVDRIQEVRGELRAGVLRRDAVPLWAIERNPASQITPGQARAAAEELARQIRSYVREEMPTAGLLLAIGLSSLVVIYLRRRARMRDGQGEDDGAELLLERPVSTALVAGLGIAAWFMDSPPRAIREIAGVLLLVPALRVLELWVPPYGQNGLRALAGFYVFDRLRGVLASLVEVERSLLLLELAAALALLLWLQRPARYRKAFDRPLAHPALSRVVTRGATLLLAIAVVADIFGYLGLSRLLGEGVLASAYTGVFIVGGLRVVETLVGQALRTRPVRERVRIARYQATTVLETMRRWLGWGAALVWAHFTLQFFAVRDSLYGSLTDALGEPLTLGALSISAGEILFFVVALWFAVVLSRLLRFILGNEVYPRISLSRGVPNALSTMLHYALILLGLSVGMGALGIDFDRIALVIGALGVGVGFGLQAIVNNFVSGLILLFERPIQVGDTIEMDTTHGDVRRIGIRSSTIRTWDGAEIIVPNADLISLRVINWTLSDRRRRIDLDVGVAYGTDPERVQEILLAAARGHGSVLSYPEPTAFFKAFGDSSLDFQLRIWVGDPDHWVSARSEINVRVNRALADAGITIPFPQRDLHIQSLPPAPAPGDGDSGA